MLNIYKTIMIRRVKVEFPLKYINDMMDVVLHEAGAYKRRLFRHEAEHIERVQAVCEEQLLWMLYETLQKKAMKMALSGKGMNEPVKLKLSVPVAYIFWQTALRNTTGNDEFDNILSIIVTQLDKQLI